jgi:hypothetical protein
MLIALNLAQQHRNPVLKKEGEFYFRSGTIDNAAVRHRGRRGLPRDLGTAVTFLWDQTLDELRAFIEECASQGMGWEIW